MGGQVGDQGVLVAGDEKIEIFDTKRENNLPIHLTKKLPSQPEATFHAEVNVKFRRGSEANHTATHLLDQALREVLGQHVEQKGSLVTPDYLRFDFSHFAAMTHEEIKKVEALVNEKILEAIPVVTQELPIAEARKLGAMALFGEKYGDIVRVVTVGDYSVEFCGGTHADNTAKLGLFRILSESSVASGVRRIEAVTGTGVLELLDSYEETMASAAKAMKLSNTTGLAEHCASLVAENKAKDRQIESLNQKISDAQMAAIFDNAKEINGVKVVSAMLSGTTPQVLRKMGDTIKDMKEPVIAVLASVNGEKGNLVCACSAPARDKGAHAGKIVQRVAAVTGGKGGGKPDSAMAGIGKTYMVDEALMALDGIAAELLKED